MNIKTNGIELNYTVEGNGPWVVMSHSLACDLSMWDGRPAVLKRNYKVLRFDTRGHGRSDAPSGEYTLDMLAYDVHGLLQGLGVERCHWSASRWRDDRAGFRAQVFPHVRYPGARRHHSRYGPERRRCGRAAVKTAQEKGMEALVESTLGRWFHRALSQEPSPGDARVSAMIRATPVPGYAGCCHAIPKIKPDHRLKEIAARRW